jgi:tetratricopeptide (TPR) repeat protein
MSRFDPPTTAGVIAMRNLRAQIDEHRLRSVSSVLERIQLIELLALRGQVCGCIADTEQAATLAEDLVQDAPEPGPVFLARAGTRSAFHLFAAALDDLDRAERRGMSSSGIRAARAAILEATGRYDDALELRREAVTRAPAFESLCALASAYAARGECDYAEQFFEESRRRYRAVSPFPLALLDFHRGHMWLEEGDLTRARGWFGEALARVPAYAPAQAHFADIDARLGNIEAAIARLRPFAALCDDPDYAAQLARILDEAGLLEDAQPWRAAAAARYDTLLELHLWAFADHGAEFWLWRDADPERALRLARVNFEVRKTPRSRDLLNRALVAHRRSAREDGGDKCDWS